MKKFMKNLNVNDVILKENPNKIMIYLRDKLLFKGELKYFDSSTFLGKLDVYTYEYMNKENKTMLIRVLEG